MLWFKALHIIFVISWFAGLLYLPRLFVYHVTCTDAIGHERFITMERRLYYYIMYPAMILSIVFGFILWSYGFSGTWLSLKLFFVFLLIGFHFSCGLYIKKLRNKQALRSAKFFKIYNEIPTLCLIIIVCLVVIKPF